MPTLTPLPLAPKPLPPPVIDLETPEVAAPAAPKNIYKRARPQISDTDTVTIPSADTFTLPKVVDEGAPPPPEEVKRTPKLTPLATAPRALGSYDPKSDWDITRGIKTAFTGAGGAMATGVDMPRLATLSEPELVQELLGIGNTKADPAAAHLTIEGVEDIHGAGDAFTFFKESAGSILGSWGAAALYGGVPGAAVGGGVGAVGGAAAGGVGALPGAVVGGGTGFTYGTLGSFLVMGPGGMLQDLTSDPGVQARLKDGTLTGKEVLALAAGPGALIGAIDAIPAGKFIAQLGGKKLTKDAVKELVRKSVKSVALKGTAKGAAEEGSTEAIQGAISEITQALAGGETNLPERALSVLNQGLVGAVGGAGPGAVGAVVENSRAELPPKADDQPEVAAVTQPEGTSAATSDAPGQSSPGGIGGIATPPPEGTDKPNNVTPVAVPAGAVDPAIGAALTGGTPAPAAAPAPAPAPQQQPGVLPDFDATEEDDLTAAAQLEREARLKEFWREEAEAEKATTAAAETTTPVVTSGVDQAVAAALAIPPKPAGETLGTGKALLPQAVPQVAPQPLPTAPPAPPTDLAPVPPATLPIVAAQEQDQGPASLPVDTAVPVAAEFGATPSLAPPRPAPVITPLATAPKPLPSELIRREEIIPPAAPALPALASAPVLPSATVPAATVPGARGQAFKRKKLVTQVIPKRTAVEGAPAAGAPTAQPTPGIAPAAAPAAVSDEMVREAASNVRDHPDLQRSTVSELREFPQTLRDVSREILDATDRTNKSPRQAILEAGPKIIAEVKRRLEAAQAELDARNVAAEEAVSKSVKVQKREEQQAAAAAKLREGKPQERERAGKTGKTAEGIVTESEKATKAAVAKELEKPEAERSPELMRWAALHEEQVGLLRKPKEGEAKRTPEEITARRAAIKAEKQQLQEARAEQVRTAERAKGGMDERARDMKARVKGVIDQVPMPEMGRMTSVETLQTARKDLRNFYNAMKAALKADGKKLPDVMDRKNYSMEENLAIYARKLIDRDVDTKGQGATEWIMARMFVAAGDAKNLYGLTTTETLRGGEEEGVALTKKQGAPSRGSLFENEAVAEETDTSERGVRGVEEEMAASPDELLPRLRQGAAARQAKDFRKSLGDTLYSKQHEVTISVRGAGKVTVDATTERASSVLRDINRSLSESGDHGFQAMIRNMLIRHLTQLVGDVDVHHVSQDDMRRLDPKSTKGPAGGLYVDYSDQIRAAGVRPMVFINEEVMFDPDEYAHTVVHELVHAATSQAIRHGIRGTDKIINSMRLALEKQLKADYTPAELEAYGLKYAFTNNYEFIAEAFSNTNLQEAMTRLAVPASLRLEIDLLGKGRPPTWWQAFTAAVSNAIGMFRSVRGLNYMEQVLKLQPHIYRSSATQQLVAERKIYGRPERGLPRAVASGTSDVEMHALELGKTGEAVRDKWTRIKTNTLTEKGRRLRYLFSTTAEMIRIAPTYFGPDSSFEAVARLHLRKDKILDNYRKSLWGDPAERNSEKVELAQRALKHEQPQQYEKMQTFLYESSLHEIDPTLPLNHPINKDVSKGGFRDEQQRAAHKRLAADYAALSKDAKDVAQATINHFRRAAETESRKHIAHTIRMAIRGYRAKLPAGKSVQDAIDWVMSGGAARIVEEQTADDKAWHTALGNTAETLAGVRELRRLRGIYVPFGRKGRFFIKATEKMPALPRGAIRDGENRFIFKNEKDLKAFANSYEGPIRITTEWIDKFTGKKLSYLEPNAVRNLVAIVQTTRVEMSDDRAALEKRRKELHDEGHDVGEVGETERSMNKLAQQMAPAQVKRLIKNLRGSTIGQTTVGQEALENAILDAQIRAMNTPGALTTRLKRRKTLGYDSLDLATSTRDYNRSLANHFANTDLAYDMAEAEAALKKFIDEGGKQREYAYGSTIRANQEAMTNELIGRMVNTRAETNSGLPRILNSVKDVAFLRHLFSPHYSIIQMMQPLMMTYPALAGKYGHGVAWRAMMEAYRIGGTASSLGKGLSETWAAAKNLDITQQAIDPGDADAHWRGLVAKEADGKELQEVFDEVVDLGFGASSGFEVPALAEEGKNSFEKAVGRLVNMAKALPTRIEAINRYTTAIAAYRAGRRTGMDHASAKREAVLQVEKSQGGYAGANNPSFFSNPLLSTALQFRKFSLAYGQLFYGALASSFAGATPAARREGRRTVARLALMTTAFAGVAGSPLAEIARMLVNVAFMLGASDDDWEDKESAMQKWLAGAIGSITGDNAGASLSEATFHGATRLIGLDTAGALGSDNLIAFGQPREMDSDGTKAWLFEAMILGASGTMVWNSMKSLSSGDIEGAIPWPKIIDNMRKAIGLYNEGTVSKTTGEQYAAPVGLVEAGYKALGFKPASESRQFETGSGIKARQERETRHERTTLMGRWASATPKERARIFREDVRDWNREHRDRTLHIDMSDLYKSKRTRAKRRKALEDSD